MKKAFPLFLVVFIVLSGFSLTGCGGGEKNSGSQPAQSQSTTTQPAKDESVASLFSKGKQIEGMSYDYTLTAKNNVMSGKVWMQGKKVKTEATVAGQKMFTIMDGDTMYTYNPAENTAIKISLKESQKDNKKPADTPSDYTEGMDMSTVSLLESTIYDGVKCKVISVKEKDNKAQMKMWVREDYGIPIRVETTEPEGGTVVMEYKNLKVGSLSSDLFQLPAGMQVTDMSEMMKQIPQMPKTPGGQQ